jgi:uncharacterized protein (DUF1499 family)
MSYKIENDLNPSVYVLRRQVAFKLVREVMANACLPGARIIIGRDNAINGGAQSLLLHFYQFRHLI